MFPGDLFSMFNKPSKATERKQKEFQIQDSTKDAETSLTKKLRIEPSIDE